MDITNYQDLESQGVSLEEIKTALEINYEGKQFRRQLHVPKSFHEKIENLAAELKEKEVSYFITETNFSYTLWQEKQEIQESKQVNETKIELTTTTNYPLPSLDYQPQRLIERKRDDNPLPVVNNQTQISSNQELVVEDNQNNNSSPTESVVWDNNNVNNTETTDTALNPSDYNDQSEETIKYRGIEIKKNTAPVINPLKKKKKVTYRGITYEV